MKITIQGTEYQKCKTIIIESGGDDMTLPQVIEDLIKPALLAWGFHPDNVK